MINRHWEVLLANQGAARMIGFLMGGRPLRHKNMLHNVFRDVDSEISPGLNLALFTAALLANCASLKRLPPLLARGT